MNAQQTPTTAEIDVHHPAVQRACAATMAIAIRGDPEVLQRMTKLIGAAAARWCCRGSDAVASSTADNGNAHEAKQ